MLKAASQLTAPFLFHQKKNKNKNNTDSSPRARRTTKRGKNPVPEIEGIPELHMTVVPGPPSAGQLTTPSGASSLSPAGSVGRASSRSFFERSSPFSMSLPSTAFSSFGPPSPCSAPAATDPPRVLPKDVKGDISKFQLEGYARKYFKSRKKGIFKRQVPIQELLTFQKVRTISFHRDLPCRCPSNEVVAPLSLASAERYDFSIARS